MPAVVAVVVTRDGGERLDSLLESIAAQDYANLVTLIVDAGSSVDPTERVAEVLPGAFVKRVDTRSYAAAADAALGTVDGASFYLFLRDDTELEQGAVQAMVEEAFRSNAGIVGAKLLRGDDHRLIRSVGSAIDKFGFLWPMAEDGELDQSQHDAVREAFVVSASAMLIRCDLFRDLGGFAHDVDGAGEALDLCWRARVAGARTVVMPAARIVHHGDSSFEETPERVDQLTLRHQMRALLVSYNLISLLRILPQAALFAFGDFLSAVFRARWSHARAVVAAFAWNVLRIPSTLSLRRSTQKSRRTPDEEIRRLQIKGSARFTNFFHEYTSRDRSMAQAIAAAARGVPGGNDPDGAGLWGVGAFIGTSLALLIGSRSLITDRVAAVREFVPIDDVGPLLTEWWTGWRNPGLGQAGGAPTINVVAWFAELLSLNNPDLARTALLLAPLPIGAIAAWRLFRGVSSPAARLACLIAYLVNPIPYNAISEGRWQALTVWAVAPVLVGRLGQAGLIAPFDRSERAARPVIQQALGLGLVLAAAATIAPVVLVVFVGLAVVMVGVVAIGNSANLRRFATISGAALGVSAVLHLPWTIAVLTASNRLDLLLGSSPGRIANVDVAAAVAFDTGSHGNALTYGLFAIVLVAVVVSFGPSVRWAMYSLVCCVGSFGLVLAAGRLAPSVSLPIAEVLLVPAAVGVALAAGIAAESVRSNVIGSAFGVRHLAAGVGIVAIIVGSVPFGTDLVNGRWNSPTSDIDVALAPLRDLPETLNGRTLWIGESDAISLQGWRIGDGMKFTVTNGVRPTVSSLFPPPQGDQERALGELILSVANGETSRIGSELAQFGIRYVVVMERFAPLPYGRLVLEIDDIMQERLNQQFDLARVDVAPGIEVYQNTAAAPVVSVTEQDPASIDSAAIAVRTPGEAAELNAGLDNPIEASVQAGRSLVVLSPLSDRWQATVGSGEPEISTVDDSVSIISTEDGGDATLRYSAPVTQTAMHLIQFVALAVVLVNRRGHRWWIGRARPHDPAMAELLDAEEVL